VGDTAYHGIPGRLFYIPAGTKHSFYHINDNYLTKHWVHFKLDTGGESIDKYYHLPLYVDAIDKPDLVECFQALNLSCSSLSDELRRNAKLMELFSIYLSLCESNGNMNYCGSNDDFSKVRNYIKANLNKKLTVTELANLMHVHPNYFIRIFKNKTGMAPVKYVNNLRCEMAKGLLENTLTPVNSIMQKVGFEESSAFSHFFHQNTGYSPHEFRKLFGKHQ
jgi:AraC-like DNA-binding protein